jgi:oxygen-dependent protoporphyrinogen oxidase
VKGKQTFQHSVFYPKAIPQYNLGYGRYRELMADIEGKVSGLFLAGHYRDGISLSDTIVSACNVVDRVGEFLKATPTHRQEAPVPA